MFQKFMINPGEILSETRLGEILSTWETTDLPTLKKLKNYYDGKQDILLRTPRDTGRELNNIVLNYCKPIVDTYTGFMGKQISLSGENIEKIQEILDYNDSHETFLEWLRQSLIYGRAFLINYIDPDGQQRIQVLDAQECVPVYDNTLEANLQYVIRCWKDYSDGNTADRIRYKVEVFGPEMVRFYNSAPGFISFEFEGQITHYYDQCPVTVFHLNQDETGIFKPILTIQDAINTLVSSQITGVSEWADAYLVLQGLTATEKDLEDMKRHRCILLDSDANTNAFFLTKNASDTGADTILTNLNNKAWSITNTPDFSDPQTFGNASSGVALEYKLIGFISAIEGIESQMRKAIQRVIELFCEILNLTDEIETWRDIEITFKHNLPTQWTEILNIVNSLRGIVSNETLLSQIPFIQSPADEMKKLEKENDFLDLYQKEEAFEPAPEEEADEDK